MAMKVELRKTTIAIYETLKTYRKLFYEGLTEATYAHIAFKRQAGHSTAALWCVFDEYFKYGGHPILIVTHTPRSIYDKGFVYASFMLYIEYMGMEFAHVDINGIFNSVFKFVKDSVTNSNHSNPVYGLVAPSMVIIDHQNVTENLMANLHYTEKRRLLFVRLGV